MSKTGTNPKPLNKVKTSLTILSVMAVLLFGAYILVDHHYAVRFDSVNREMERIRHEVVEPLGGVELSGGGYKPTMIGNDFLRFTGCGPDLTCPQIARSWYVPIEPGQEQVVARSVAQKAGYKIDAIGNSPCSLLSTNMCGISASKGNFSVGIDISAATGSPATPEQAVGSKVWRRVHILLNLN